MRLPERQVEDEMPVPLWSTLGVGWWWAERRRQDMSEPDDLVDLLHAITDHIRQRSLFSGVVG